MHYPIPPFAGFTNFTPTLPKFYWDIYDKEQIIKHLCKLVHKVCCYAEQMGISVNEYVAQVEELEAQFEQFKESGFEDYYYEQIVNWINNNFETVANALLYRMVFFGLNQEGYFVAYVPDSWNDIIFDTGAVFGESDYGRLILKYDVDSPETIEQ